MPTETATKPIRKSKGMRIYNRHRTGTEESQADSQLSKYESDSDGILPLKLRERLYDLFGQIEKEFESIYADNITLHDKIETLTERLEAYSLGGEKGIPESQDVTDFPPKAKKSASQISQKIKTTYKASTSKLVSSFRTPSSGMYSLVKSYRGHRDGVWEVNVSRSDNPVVGTASADHTARIWCIDSGECLLQYLGHQGSVNCIRFHASQDLVLTASGDQTAHIWRMQLANNPVTEAGKSHSSGEDDLDGSEKEDTEGNSSRLKKEELLEGDVPDHASSAIIVRNCMQSMTGHSNVVISADWLAGGSQVITASWDRTGILFDAETGEQLSFLPGHDQELTDVRAHPDQRLVVTSSKDTTFRLWDFRAANMEVNVFQGHTQPVTSAVFAGETVVSGSDDRTIKVWDLRNMRSAVSSTRTDSAVNRIAVSQHYNMIAVPHDNRHIRLYDSNLNRVGRLPRTSRMGHNKMVTSVAWAEDHLCNLFSCGFDRQVLGWSVNTQTKE